MNRKKLEHINGYKETETQKIEKDLVERK